MRYLVGILFAGVVFCSGADRGDKQLMVPVKQAGEIAENQRTNSDFSILSGMNSRMSEVLARHGIPRIAMVYTSRLWPHTKSNQQRKDLPQRETVEAIARELSPNLRPLVVFDIEHWPLDIRKTAFKDSDDLLSGDLGQIKESRDKQIQILQWAKAANPALQYGYYSCVPIRDYFTPVRRDPGQIKDWQAANDVLLSLADAADALFPSLYTFYEDQEGWQQYARGVIGEARRLAKGKPVYVFLWPRYHGSNKALGNRLVAGDFWGIQLETVYSEGVRGIVIWGASREQWDPEAQWWQETQAFMSRKGIQSDIHSTRTTPKS
jgi:hypothetical protein